MSGNREIPGSFFGRSGCMSVDQETKQRDPSFKFGIITCDPNRRILSVVRNISPTGALLEVNDALEIPDQFTLAIESEPSARVCCVAWRKAKQIAVNFDVMGGGAAAQDQGHDGPKDRRQAPRKSQNTAGWIRLDGSFAMRECKIVDVSTAGVRLAIPFAGKIPETFTLLFSKGAQGHRVRVIWRRANQIGARFV